MAFGGAVKYVKKRTKGGVGGVAGGLGAGIAGNLLGDITGAKDVGKARKAQNKAIAVEHRRAIAQQTREKRQMINEARIARASALAGAAAEGVGTASSAFRGTLAASQTNVATKVGESQIDLGYAQMIAKHEAKAGKYQARAQDKQSVLDLGFKVAGIAGL